jgi:hypothetical protein
MLYAYMNSTASHLTTGSQVGQLPYLFRSLLYVTPNHCQFLNVTVKCFSSDGYDRTRFLSFFTLFIPMTYVIFKQYREFKAMIIWHTYWEHKPKGENLYIFFKLRSSVLLLPIAGYQKIRRWGGLHKNTINMQYCENQSTVQKFKWRDSQINGKLHVHKHVMVFSQDRRYFLRNGQYATSGLKEQRWTCKITVL